jgi:hypothetical protein
MIILAIAAAMIYSMARDPQPRNRLRASLMIVALLVAALFDPTLWIVVAAIHARFWQ